MIQRDVRADSSIAQHLHYADGLQVSDLNAVEFVMKTADNNSLHYDKDRLKHPVRRTDHGWQRIGWDEAFDEVTRNLKRIHATYGRI